MKRYIIFTGSTTYCGTEYTVGQIYPPGISDEVIQSDCNDICDANAESYSWMVEENEIDRYEYSCEGDYEDDLDELMDEYFLNCRELCQWEEVPRGIYIDLAEENDWWNFDKKVEDA